MASLFDYDFDLWNEDKKKLNRFKRIVHPKTREIWYIKIGVNVGNELFGKSGFFRPALVISIIGNMYFALPLTTKSHNEKYYIQLKGEYFKKDSFVVISQGRMFDVQRFFTRIAIMTPEEFSFIKNLLRYKYFPEDFS